MLKCKFNKRGDPVVPGMKISLMPHQLIGVKWMIEREDHPELGRKVKIQGDENRNYGKMKTISTVGGGLLADEMGLGKTIQSIALMVNNRPDEDEPVKVIFFVGMGNEDNLDCSTTGVNSSMEKGD